MPFDATGASLPDVFRSLNVAPDYKEALVRLAEKVSQLEHEREYQQMLSEAEQQPPGPPPSPKRRTPHDQRWLHIVRGAVVIPFAAAAGFTRAHARYVAASAAGAALLTGGTLAPDMMAQAPAAQLPPSPHHAVAHHRHREAVVLPPGMPAARKQRRSGPGETARPGPSGTPSASPSAEPDPSPTAVPGPAPVPVPVPATPAPDPTCAHPGKHCHGGDAAGDAVRVPGALARLS